MPLVLALVLASSAGGQTFSYTADCKSKLDLLCGDVKRPQNFIEFKPAQERYQNNAITIRFGGPTKNSPSKFEVQVGSFLQKALFIVAVIVTLS